MKKAVVIISILSIGILFAQGNDETTPFSKFRTGIGNVLRSMITIAHGAISNRMRNDKGNGNGCRRWDDDRARLMAIISFCGECNRSGTDNGLRSSGSTYGCAK